MSVRGSAAPSIALAALSSSSLSSPLVAYDAVSLSHLICRAHARKFLAISAIRRYRRPWCEYAPSAVPFLAGSKLCLIQRSPLPQPLVC